MSEEEDKPEVIGNVSQSPSAESADIKEWPSDVRIEDLADSSLQLRGLDQATATWVAQGIVTIFGLLMMMALIGGFWIIMKCSACSQETGKNTITESVIPFIKELGAFAQTVFGPLLAFVLGYYFAKK